MLKTAYWSFLYQQACPNCSVHLNLAIIKRTYYMPNQCSLRCVHAHSKGGHRLGRTEKAVSKKALHCWTSLTQLYSNAAFLFCTVSCHDMQLDACVQCWAMTIRQLFKILWLLKYVYTSGITPQKLCMKASWEFCEQSTFYWNFGHSFKTVNPGWWWSFSVPLPL